MTSVPTAIALGWHVTELFHGTIPREAPQPPAAAPLTLPGLSDFTSYELFGLRLAQIDTGIQKLGPTAQSADIKTCLAKIRTDVAEAKINHDAVAGDVVALHKALLTALTAGDFQLGKAYGLGRALAETVLIPCDAKPAERAEQFAAQFKPYRLTNLYNWLADLKSSLPPHAAYAVSFALRSWATLVNPVTPPVQGQSFDATDERAARALHRQGQVWRSLLSGEKNGQDFLKATDFVQAAVQLVRRFRALLGGFLEQSGTSLLIALVVVVIVGAVVAAGVALFDKGTAVWAGLATLLAGLAGTWQSVSKALGQAIAKAQQPLWDSELDESIALAATYLPKGVPKPTRQPDDKVGELALQGGDS
jgi:hypothetical protein